MPLPPSNQAGSPDAPASVRRPRRLPVTFAPVGEPEVVAIRSGISIVERRARRQPPTPPPKIGIHFPAPTRHYAPVRWLLWALIGFAVATAVARAQTTNTTAAANPASRLLEAAGVVEVQTSGRTNWSPAAAGIPLRVGDRIRTHPASRAAVQLSDRSVIRLSERTTLEILPPRRSEKKRFGLPAGALYFFNREKPADVEFDTPLAAGAIRGTEFLLQVAEADSAVRLALIDGLVALNTGGGEVQVERGHELRLQPNQPPQTTALVNATAAIQWALYYPAVLDLDELALSADEQTALGTALTNYRTGDLLAAFANWPADFQPTSAGVRALRAQLELAVGRVVDAERMLAELPADNSPARALRELIGVVRANPSERRSPIRREADLGSSRMGDRHSASELLARSYELQAQADLEAARAVAREAVKLAPNSGFARTRLAELEFSFGERRAALAELEQAVKLGPRLAPAHALRGFILLDQGDAAAARDAFDHARELDAAFGPAWLGRGLCQLRNRDFREARAAFQAAAALEPQRSLFRSYLGKAASELGDAPAAEKEFRLAQTLDANDPTAWLYSALHLWQQNRLNEAIRDLETSASLNDQRAVFRSHLLLDQDRSVRSANLAALYEDAGVPDASRHAAARAVSESYANFSGHLFLADSLASLEDVNRFNLRYESARQSELLVANLLAPPGAGNLSQQLSQQDHLRFFDQRPVGVSSLTEYRSGGDCREAGTVFGSANGFSYAFDANYESVNGQQPNGSAERREFALTLKQPIAPDDEAYFQIGLAQFEAGDVASYYDPAQAKTGFRVRERQEPTLYAGWHHTWSPGSHTLLLFARLDDQLTLHDEQPNVLFLRQLGAGITEVQSPPAGPPFTLESRSDFTLYSAELQHIWETPRHSLVAGGRWQSGSVDTHAILSRVLTGVITDQQADDALERGDLYAYATWRVGDRLQLIGGASYSHLTFPQNADLPPIGSGEAARDLISPKVGLLFQPWERGLLRASYTKSLGGLYFDNSVRLEPTEVAGFNQALRSLIPESVAGLVAGTEFETVAVGFDQSLPRGTWFGLEAERLTSDGERTVGALTNSLPLFFWPPDSPAGTRETLAFREHSLSAYAGQLLGNNFSVGARYRVSEAELTERFPEIPVTATGLAQLEGNDRATLQQLSLTVNFHHRGGGFAQWESAWHHQENAGDSAALADADFWQHNLIAGYRFARRRAELRIGVLNLLDQDYRLNPLNLHAELPRARTFVTSLRLNF